VTVSDKPEEAFNDVDYAYLVGARPRGPGMERKDLLEANGAIFKVQGKALNDHAKRSVKILVVGNPANTNAMIAKHYAPDLDTKCFSAMVRLDHNRAMSKLAEKTGMQCTDVKRAIIWGNHSATQYPDLHHATVNGNSALDKVDQDWYEQTFIPKVQQRGAEIIQVRGASSAASAANAAVDHMRSWALGTPDGEWVSMAVPSDGSYGIKEGVVYGYPVVCKNGGYEIVQDLEINEFSRARMEATEKELLDSWDAVQGIL